MDTKIIDQLQRTVLQTNNSQVIPVTMINTRVRTKVVDEPNQYFNETIFTTGESIARFSKVSVYNNADLYLANLLGKQVVSNSTRAQKNDNPATSIKPKDTCPMASAAKLATLLDEATIININPPIPYNGINIYTMNGQNIPLWKQIPYNIIRVVDVSNVKGTVFDQLGSVIVPVYIGQYVTNQIYDVSQDLTNFESAIMIKYYATNNEGVTITKHLFNVIEKYFKDGRIWFNHDLPNVNLIRQTSRGELLRNGSLLNVPILTFYGPPILL